MKMLFLDIETFPTIMTRWSLYSQGGGYDNIVQDWSIICFAYKWLGEKKVNVISVRDNQKKFKANVHDDSYVMKKISALYDEADVVCGHNIIKFDHKKINTRMIMNGLKPLPPVKKYDTLKVARSMFSFTSNRLDALGEMLGVGRKIKTSYSLWLRCLKGEVAAFKEMEKYNKQDVLLLEDVYLKLAPFDQIHPNLNLYQDTLHSCPTCGSDKVHRRGTTKTRVTEFQRYQCQACGSWSKLPKNGKGVLR